MRTTPRSARRSRGFTLVELMVGTAVGLFVVAAVTGLVVRQIGALRAVSHEARVTQELRHVAELVARDLRRAGHWEGAASGVAGDDGSAGAVNPYAFDAASSVASGEIRVRYSRDTIENGVVDGNEQFGFRLRRGAVELQLGDANWQQITDPATVVVPSFDVTPRVESTSLEAFCTEPCAVGSTTCPPGQQLAQVEIAIAGRSARDPAVVRAMRDTVAVRQASVVGRCET